MRQQFIKVSNYYAEERRKNEPSSSRIAKTSKKFTTIPVQSINLNEENDLLTNNSNNSSRITNNSIITNNISPLNSRREKFAERVQKDIQKGIRNSLNTVQQRFQKEWAVLSNKKGINFFKKTFF